MNVSAPFILRPIATTLLMIGLSAGRAGRLCAAADRRRAAGRCSDDPGDAPICRAPAPRPWRRSVATPLERQLALISGVTSLSSTSSLGQTSITVEFDLGRSVDGAAQDVQTAISAAGGQLPKRPARTRRPTRRPIRPTRCSCRSPSPRTTCRSPKSTIMSRIMSRCRSRASPASGSSISTASRSRRCGCRSIPPPSPRWA